MIRVLSAESGASYFVPTEQQFVQLAKRVAALEAKDVKSQSERLVGKAPELAAPYAGQTAHIEMSMPFLRIPYKYVFVDKGAPSGDKTAVAEVAHGADETISVLRVTVLPAGDPYKDAVEAFRRKFPLRQRYERALNESRRKMLERVAVDFGAPKTNSLYETLWLVLDAQGHARIYNHPPNKHVKLEELHWRNPTWARDKMPRRAGLSKGLYADPYSFENNAAFLRALGCKRLTIVRRNKDVKIEVLTKWVTGLLNEHAPVMTVISDPGFVE
jgi:hypothetical protein